MTTWHWVRHGPTHEKAFVGWRDVPADLSDTAQISRLRQTLPGEALVISSDLLRASSTADAITGPGHNRLDHHAGLREMHFGDWDGMHFEAVAERDPFLSRSFWEEPGDVSAPGGESWNMAARRVSAVVQQMNVAHPGAEIIAVAHFGVILTQIQQALQVPAYDAMAHRIDNLSVTTISWDGDSGKVHRINHLS